MKKKFIFALPLAIIGICFAMVIIFSIFQNQPIDKTDLINHKEMLLAQGLPNLPISESAVIQQAGRSYILYQQSPIQNKNQEATGLLYGFLRIRKDFGHYRIAEKQNFFYDMTLNLKYITGQGFGSTYFGVILDSNVYRIELYSNQILAASFVRSPDHNFYFIAVPNGAGPIDQEIYYGRENEILAAAPG